MVRTAPSSRACRRRSSHPAAPFNAHPFLTWSPEPIQLVLPENPVRQPTHGRGVRPAGGVVRQHGRVRARPRLLVIVTLAEAGGAQTFAASLFAGVGDRYAVEVAAHGPDGALV